MTAIRHIYSYYNTDAAYIDRRVIGLLSQKQVFDGAGNLYSRVFYGYDWAGELFVDTPGPATQHDRANYGPSFVVGRGNLQHVIRVDASDPGNSSKWQETKFRYDTVGAVRAARDHDWHESSFGYTDSFSDGVVRNAFAYPTTHTDAGGHSSTAKYDFHTGAVVRTQDPKGAVREMQYDSVGRLEKVTTPFDGAFTQWSYPWTYGYVQQFSTVNNTAAESYSIKMLDGAGRVVSAATGHPYSQGGYRAQHFTFDVMGRMSSQTNPGEIDGWWTPAGEDAAGWQVTTQTYDWNGRPRVTTNADATTREVSYEGCGCAGSQVVTTTDEVGRRRRATFDVLGRLWKSEVLNTDGSAYRTVTNTYNALDQLTQVSDQAAGGATQITTMTYDGHGRLLTRKYPHESAATTFSYHRDDRPEAVTDGRGVTNVYTFDTRHLLTGVDYGTAAGVASTPDVSYEYDEAGNRTQMAEDGQVRAAYEYDALSRLKKETRQFPGLTGSYELNYEYNLAGQLKEFKDHTNAVTYYNYDSEGRPHSVTAGGATYGGVTTYASAVKYRAWGAVKSLDYGNQMWLSAEYDARMRMTQFKVGGSTSAPTVMLSDFRYDADGSLRFASAGSATDGVVSMYDRAYKYDHAGRLVEAFTSQQANDYHQAGAVGAGGGQYVPYRQTYSYDAWGNRTYRDNWYWERQDTRTANFADNRRTELGWHYDGAGNLTQSPDVALSYDAAGRNRTATSLGISPPKVITQWQDGDGQVVKRLEEEGTTSETVFYLRSNALGGMVAAELNAQGVKTKGKIYLGGELIAEHGEHQPTGARWVEWKHRNPLTGKSGVSDASRSYLADYANLDSDGIDIGPPTLFYPEEGIPDEGQPAALYGSGIPDGRCTWHDMPIDCAEVSLLTQNGAAMSDPGMEFGRRRVPVEEDDDDPSTPPLTEPFVERLLPTQSAVVIGFAGLVYVPRTRIVWRPSEGDTELGGTMGTVTAVNEGHYIYPLTGSTFLSAPGPQDIKAQGEIGTKLRCPPLAQDLARNPKVVQAMSEAWADSKPGQRDRREHGGWVYWSPGLGDITTRRKLGGGSRTRINLNNPPKVDGYIVVAFFHTHPNLRSQKGDPDPSAVDLTQATLSGIPGLVAHEGSGPGLTMEIHTYGPHRRGGLPERAGPGKVEKRLGFPGNSEDNRKCDFQ